MKIGIITRHSISNYGSVFQSFATQKVLEKLGHESKIIDYVREDENDKNIVKTYCTNKGYDKNIVKKLGYYFLQGINIKIMNKKFRKIRQKYLIMTDKTYENGEELSFINEFDVLCTGSDQVWGQIGNDEFDSNYFLAFANEKTKCISFSASFGKGIISECLKNKLDVLLKKYSFITVREESAKKIILENTRINNVETVLDPTMLLKKEEWDKFATKNIDEEYILVYQLHHNKKFDEYLKIISKELGLKVYRISPSLFFRFKYGKLKYLPDLEGFLSLVKNANLVVTDSFHGTVFSLMFNVPMVDILPKITSSRIVDILEMVGLGDRIISDYDDIKIVHETIDFETVNIKINEKREDSLTIIKGMLENEK